MITTYRQSAGRSAYSVPRCRLPERQYFYRDTWWSSRRRINLRRNKGLIRHSGGNTDGFSAWRDSSPIISSQPASVCMTPYQHLFCLSWGCSCRTYPNTLVMKIYLRRTGITENFSEPWDWRFALAGRRCVGLASVRLRLVRRAISTVWLGANIAGSGSLLYLVRICQCARRKPINCC